MAQASVTQDQLHVLVKMIVANYNQHLCVFRIALSAQYSTVSEFSTNLFEHE